MPEHTGVLREDLIEDHYSASCSCGWEGLLRSSNETARLDMLAHLDETACENTGKDIDR